jgi:hypothetical protein
MNKRGAYQKKAQNKENVEARHALLKDGLKSPKSITKSVAISLTGQRAFCSLVIPGSKVAPISLNTLKALAGELYGEKEEAKGDGFGYLDAMRIKLKELLESTPTGRSVQAKSDRQRQQTEDLAGRVQELENQNTLRSKAYLDLYSKINRLIKKGDMEETSRLRLTSLLSKHHALYGNLFNPGSEFVQDGGGGAVVPLTKGKGI